MFKVATWIATALIALLFCALTLGFGLLWLRYTVFMGVLFGLPNPLVTTVGLVLLLVSLLAVHEGGHAVAGLLVGLPPTHISVGPVQFVRRGRGFRARLNRDFYKPAAFVRVEPTAGHNLISRMAIVVAGGPLANLVVGVLCLVLASRLNKPGPDLLADYLSIPWQGNFLLYPQNQAIYWLNLAGLASFLFFLGDLLPRHRDGHHSDGAHLLFLLWGRDSPTPGGTKLGRGFRSRTRALHRDWNARALYSALQKGVRPRNWDAALVEEMLALRDNSSSDRGANYLGYVHAEDTGQFERAGQLLDLALRQLEGSSTTFQAAVRLEGAYFEAFRRHNAAAARAWLEQAQDGEVEQHTRARAEAAVLLAEGRRAEAVARAEEGLAAVPLSKDPGGSIAERDWLNAVLAEARKTAG